MKTRTNKRGGKDEWDELIEYLDKYADREAKACKEANNADNEPEMYVCSGLSAGYRHAALAAREYAAKARKGRK